MPRVSTRTRKRKEVKRQMRCAAHPCVVAKARLGDRLDGDGVSFKEMEAASEIRVGDMYYTWSRRNRGTYFQHQECGYPKRSQLSDRKTVQIEDAIDDAQATLDAWVPVLDDDGTYTGGYDDVSDALADVESVASSVAQEYQDGFDNMPEGLNQGPTAQAMEEVSQELDSWGQDLASWSPDEGEPELPEQDEDESDDDWRDRKQDALDAWAEDVRSSATDKMSDMPEYQG